MSNLLEKASIITTPTAYDVGFINSVKPEQNLGEELITNGDFSNGSTDWTLSDWTVANGKASIVNGSSFISQDGILQVGRTYKIQYTISDYVSGNIRWRSAGVNGSVNVSNGLVTDFITVGSTNFSIQGYNSFNGSISNISAKEVIGADFTFTRNTIATRVNASGLIESVANNLPRIDYTGGGCGSWLLEPQRTNLIPRSNEFNFWNNLQNKLTITSNSITSPDGTVNGTKLTQAVSSSNARLRYSGILTIGTEYTFSVYAKKGNHDELIMNISGVSTTFTLTDDWVRYEITETAPNNTFVDVGITNAVVGDFIYIYGAQAEEADYATSYIPTSGTPVTRNQDLATDAGNSNLISSTEGVLYAELKSISEFVDSPMTISINNNNTTNRLLIYKVVGDNKLKFQIKNPSATVGFTSATTNTTFDKVAIKYKSLDYAVWINGVEVFTDTTTSSVPTGLSRLDFSEFDSSSIFQGNARCVAVFKEALTDAELTALTTI